MQTQKHNEKNETTTTTSRKCPASGRSRASKIKKEASGASEVAKQDERRGPGRNGWGETEREVKKEEGGKGENERGGKEGKGKRVKRKI